MATSKENIHMCSVWVQFLSKIFHLRLFESMEADTVHACGKPTLQGVGRLEESAEENDNLEIETTVTRAWTLPNLSKRGNTGQL